MDAKKQTSKRKPSPPKKSNSSTRSPLSQKRLLAKARVLAGDEVEESQALSTIDEMNKLWGDLGAVIPPYEPQSLLRYIEMTPHLRPCIEAMSQNIDGYGFQFEFVEPWLSDLSSSDAADAIEEALFIEDTVTAEEEAISAEVEQQELEEKISRLRGTKKRRELEKAEARLKELLEPSDPSVETPVVPQDGDEGSADDEPYTDDEFSQRVAETIKVLETQIRREQYLFNAFFKNCCSEMSFTRLRKICREDYEAHGWACMEFKRDGYGRLKRIGYIPAYTVRPMKSEGEVIDVVEDDSVTPLSIGREVIVKRRFRIYVQIVNNSKVYFKSAGDPRVVSRKTGKAYKTIEEMRRPADAEKTPGEGKDAEPANELLWFSQHDPQTPCPPPRWIGNLLAVLGVREADETNYYYLADNAIPAGLLFVHGGTVSKATRERVEKRIQNEIGGSENSGKILVIEARPGGQSNPNDKTMMPSLTFQSLREAHTNDALFTTYDTRSADRIGASFRLSPLLRGYTPSNLNRATALAAISFSEQQVFQPERQDFDWIMNKYVLPELGIKLLKFKSNSPPTRSADDISRLIQAAGPQGGFIPEEIRELLSDVLNRQFKKIDEEWAKKPFQLTLSGNTGGGVGLDSGGQPDDAQSVAERLRRIETNLAMVLTEELREAGLGYDISLQSPDGIGSILDRHSSDGDGDE